MKQTEVKVDHTHEVEEDINNPINKYPAHGTH